MSTCTCHGQELLLAARIPGLRGIEMNPREYVTSANAGWEKRFPGIFTIRCGK
jgi:hypothetical protein